jgi:class 3 adenylate cyclase
MKPVSERLDRRLVAVMFTDMVGYTALIQADERVGLDKRDRYMRALETQHDAFGGTIVQRLGDGSMSMFPSSLAALLAAIEIQRELAAQEVPVRIGVHVGEVLVEPERLTGDAVNIAARIESFAAPGGVLLSDSAYDQVKNRSDVGVVPLGRFRLKNVGRPFELYAISADGLVVPDPATLEGKGDRFASLPSNLPKPAVPLVGRAADLASLVELAREHGSSRSRAPAASERLASSSSSDVCSRPSSWTASRSSSWRTLPPWRTSSRPSRRRSTSRRPRDGRSAKGSLYYSVRRRRCCSSTTSSESWPPRRTWPA